MLGDTADMVRRLRAVLPRAWFTDDVPVLDALLRGLGEGWAALHEQIAYVRRQTRIATATEGWLDLISRDYFGLRVRRRRGQGDDAFRARILRELLRPRVTRPSLVRVVTELTGTEPLVFEPRNPSDTGGYNVGGVGYGVAGGYGSLRMPAQGFVTAYRPTGGGIAEVSGYGQGAGGYGVGAIEWGNLALRRDQVTDQDILDAIVDVLPVGTVAWVAITDRPGEAVWDVFTWDDGSVWAA